MSEKVSGADLRASSTLLNTLHAEHQGAFVHQTVLARLDHPAFEAGLAPRLQDRLRTIGEWGERLWRGELLLFADGSSPRQEELDRALAWLDDVSDRLEVVGRGLEAALDAVAAHAHDGEGPREVALVAAGQAWASYAWENELRGVARLGEVLEDSELVDRALERLPAASDGLKVLHDLLARLEEPGPPGCGLLGELHRSAAHLPGLLGAKTEALRGLAAEVRELQGR